MREKYIPNEENGKTETIDLNCPACGNPWGNGEHIECVRNRFETFSEEKEIANIGDRVQRGLDPIGMIALPEIKARVEKIAEKEGANYEDVEEIILDIQTNGPWDYVDDIQNATSPEIRTWIELNAINTTGKEREMDMTDDEFHEDLKRIEGNFDQAESSENFFEEASQHVLEESQKRLRIEDDVPISEMDNGFVTMALQGYEAGIIQDSDGMLFVGSKNPFEEEMYEKWGLHKELRKDRGRKDIPFYVNDNGDAIVKQLHPGFAIVLSRNFELAKNIAKVGNTRAIDTIESDTLGHKHYAPTSAQEETPDLEKVRTTRRIPDVETEGRSFKDDFYKKFANIKARQIFRDSANAYIGKKREKDERVTNDELESLARKTQEKVGQKMDELHYMMEAIGPELESLPEGTDKVIDMAGGAGDLGMATAVEAWSKNVDLKKIEIVDPFDELRKFNGMIIKDLPESKRFEKAVDYKVAPLQEADIDEKSIVVAKHACGDLTDEIIEKWVNSESPMLCAMTCCQDKAKDQPARYDISQENWRKWCKVSAKTNSSTPAKKQQGMEAMTKLDNARLAYLKRRGFEAKLIQNESFPKGDIIIAKRNK